MRKGCLICHHFTDSKWEGGNPMTLRQLHQLQSEKNQWHRRSEEHKRTETMEGKLLFNLHLRLDPSGGERPSLPIQLRLPMRTAIWDLDTSVEVQKLKLDTSTFSPNSPGNACIRGLVCFPFPQHNKQVWKGRELVKALLLQCYWQWICQHCCLPAPPRCQRWVKLFSYLLPCTTQHVGDTGDQSDHKEESALSECNFLTYFKTSTGGWYIPHPKRAFSSLLITLGA